MSHDVGFICLSENLDKQFPMVFLVSVIDANRVSEELEGVRTG